MTELIHGAVDGDSVKLLFFEDGQGVVIIQISKVVQVRTAYVVCETKLRVSSHENKNAQLLLFRCTLGVESKTSNEYTILRRVSTNNL